MLDVFIDRACGLAVEPRMRELHPEAIDLRDDADVERLKAGGVLLMAARTKDGKLALPALRALRQANPRVVVVLCALRREIGQIGPDRCVRAGADEVLAFDTSIDVREVVCAVRLRTQTPPPGEELERLNELREASRERDAVMYALRNAEHALTGGELARKFGCSLRELRRRLRRKGYPKPRDVCRAGCLLKAMELRDRGIDSAQERAQRLGFDDATQKRKVRSRLRHYMLSDRDNRLREFVMELPRLENLLFRRDGA